MTEIAYNHKVLAIDPGITTGFVWAILTPQEFRVTPFQHRFTEQQVLRLLEEMQPTIIVYEDFEFRQQARDNLELFSVAIIGIIRLYQQQHPEVKLYKQKASVGKGGHFKDREKMKQMGCYVAGEAKHHAMDAMRHIMQWYFFREGYQFNKGQPVILEPR